MEEIVYFDRYQNRECIEKVYGDKALRWTYGTTVGKLSLELLVRKAVFSRWYGWRMDHPASRAKVQPFIEKFELDSSEFLDSPDSYQNFNEFFSRKLKPSARPIDPNPDTIVFPADGRHLCISDLSKTSGLFVKGQMFDVHSLIQDRRISERYSSGSLLLSRLCPVDYHRFHFPVAGVPGPARLINGPLYSVNPVALCQNIHILTTNKRCVTEVETEDLGKVLLIEVGATCVGSICQTFQPGQPVTKGAEKGYFRFGGSSTITLFEQGRIRFDTDLVRNSLQHRELYARIGDHMAVRV
ncbi:MAG: phosphatidylserine decarboxylase [Planctomyces sp.]|nr:phosphatidylserine decarboxylase [Planctomyces sp.]